MGKWGWFSADDDGNVIAKTEVQDNGSVDRYPYTKPDDIHAGHGHEHWKSMDSYLHDDEHPDKKYRDKNAKKSINRRWKGPGYDLALEVLNNLSLEELQELLEISSEDYVHTSEEMFVIGTHKQLVLK